MYTWNFDTIGFQEDPNLECNKQKKATTYASQNGTLFVYGINSEKG